MPSSPALSGVGSPSIGPTSVPLSQQQAELAKAARKPIIHLLALGPTSERALKEMLPQIGNNDFKQTLQKVGDLNESTGKHELRKSFYKELDVWSYNYANPEDRQRAIDNAVKQYDRMRLGVSEPQWDRLLPKAERGTGKSLSKLQAQIARGDLQRPPKIKVQKEDGSGRDTSGPEDEGSIGDKKVSKVKGESMTRSVSQPPATKTKKVGEKETQAKKLLSKNTSKPTPKSTPAPPKNQKSAKTWGKVLSSEFVEDSDEEDDYLQQPPKPAPKPVAAPKRSREEDAESSDSSIPLSKKVKKGTTTTTTAHRISDASQSSRTTNTSTHSSSSTKTKDTSPQKSSPLASSPPTNASDVDNSSGDRTSSSSSASPANHLSSKNSRSPIHKRHHKSSSVASSVSSTSSSRYLKPEVMDLARKYRSYYPKYEALHRELAGMKSRNHDKELKLLDMHERLAQMKRDINAGIVEVS
jgi:RNA polymerase II elongation factor ELL